MSEELQAVLESEFGEAGLKEAYSFHGGPSEAIPYWEQRIGADTRQPVLATALNPWRYICKIETNPHNLSFGGTGTLIAPNRVLTAAHVVHRVAAANIRVIPGKRGPTRGRTDEPFGNTMVTAIRMNPSHSVAGDDFDYAVLVLADDIGRRVGHWRRIAAWDDDRVRVRKSNLAGYPADLDPGRNHLYHAYHSHVSVVGRHMDYLHDTYGGMSGSPIWIRWQETRTMVGIHVDFDDGVGVVANQGIHINDGILTDIRSWL